MLAKGTVKNYLLFCTLDDFSDSDEFELRQPSSEFVGIFLTVTFLYQDHVRPPLVLSWPRSNIYAAKTVTTTKFGRLPPTNQV